MLRGQGLTMIQTKSARTGIGRVQVPSPDEVVGASHFATGGSRIQPSLSLHAMIMSKHRVQHTPSTASSQDRLSPALSQSLISQLSADLVVLNSLHSHNYELTNE